MPSLYDIYQRHIAVADPEFFAVQDAAAIEALRSKARRHYLTRWPWLTMLLVVLVGCLGMALLVAGVMRSPETPANWRMGALAGFIGFVALVAGFLGDRPPRLFRLSSLVQDALSPLSHDSSACMTAKGLVKRRASARAYRDSVVDTGRELLKVDVAAMDVLRDREVAESQRVECLHLHGLVDDTAVAAARLLAGPYRPPQPGKTRPAF